jgi:hypothetical protein
VGGVIVRTCHYYYEITDIYYQRTGHIARSGKEVFLCGKTFDNSDYERESYALPGLKLCEDCKIERDRIERGNPTRINLVKWWAGGREAHQREMGENQ